MTDLRFLMMMYLINSKIFAISIWSNQRESLTQEILRLSAPMLNVIPATKSGHLKKVKITPEVIHDQETNPAKAQKIHS